MRAALWQHKQVVECALWEPVSCPVTAVRYFVTERAGYSISAISALCYWYQ